MWREKEDFVKTESGWIGLISRGDLRVERETRKGMKSDEANLGGMELED